MLTRIRNSAAARRSEVVVPFSKAKMSIAKILEKTGFLGDVVADEEAKTITVKIRYNGRRPAFEAVRRVSKPGRRVYAKSDELPTVRSATGIAVVSTSQGMMTNVEAKARKLGGEIVCEIY